VTNSLTPHFDGFRPAALAFLRDLAGYQDRAWFEAHKDVYEQTVREPLGQLVAALSDELAERRLPLEGDPTRSLFRIQRDIRFSHDKRPYKTHAGATLTRDGQKMSPGLLYVHVDPEGSFAAAGAYQPATEALAAIRRRIVARPAAYRRVLRALASAGLRLDEDEAALKRLPRGFEKVTAEDLSEAVRRKSFIVRTTLAKSALAKPGLPAEIADFAKNASPLLKFIWQALDEN
jgi:uncharacterized protein (TIGR02453 family)